jgi:SRSO17 transposase
MDAIGRRARERTVSAGRVRQWGEQFERAMAGFGHCFKRRDLRRQANSYVRGLLGRVERKNGWQLAEHLGKETPYSIQRLLGRASWDADQVRDELTRYARSHLRADGDDGVLIIDETGFLKKGNQSAGVQRQYCGTAGRIENCQVGVFLAMATARGHALIDRSLYLPQSWCEDPARRRRAGIADAVGFATKPHLAMAMLQRAFDAGMRPKFVLADEVYGSDSKFRHFLEQRGQAYVVAVGSQQRLWVELSQQRVDAIARTIPPQAWRSLSVADGSKGPRVYDWAATRFGSPTEKGLHHWLLVRRHPTTHELAYYFCTAPPETTAAELVIAAGQRWAIETCFESAKQETGLDEYEVRSWTGWHRHVTLSMLAMAFLTAVRLAASAGPTPAAPASKRPRPKSRRR